MTTLASVSVDGVFNLRDLGGHATESGRVVRQGLILRADGLHRADEAGRVTLATRGLRTVVDLRTSDELTGDGRFEHPDVQFRHIPIIDSLEEVNSDGLEAEPVGDVLLERYQDWLAGSAQSFASALTAIAASVDEGRTVAFHCTAGKDRTGVLAALILGGLGVGDDVIVADYARSEGVAEHLREWYGKRADREMMERMRASMSANMQVAMMGAQPATMAALLAHLRANWGGVEAYVTSIGADDALKRIAAALVTES